jgi:glycosyltransferase involved in cell wall biosynthesis
MTLVSFVIANYNYEKFVAQCIDSALASDWPDIEVIVVDDGSTDGSRDVIDRFGDRITKIYQQNAGQRIANNAGFAASKGEIVVFLDADDTVDPGFVRKVCSVWRPGVSKVQVQMIRIDANGTPFGTPFPEWDPVPTPEDIRRWAFTTSEYPTPPGSGNAYGRDFLDLFFPIGPEHDSSTDSTCLVMAPLLGDVISIREPLATYRRHGNNDSNLLSDPRHFAREMSRAIHRQRSADLICGALGKAGPGEDILRRSWYVLQLRAASLRTAPERHPLTGDNRLAALVDAFRNLPLASAEPLKRRLKASAWAALTLMAPKSMADRLVRMRFGERA